MFVRLLFFCGLSLAATSLAAMTVYKSIDANGVVSYSDRPSPGAQKFLFRDRMVAVSYTHPTLPTIYSV